ncbi:hypothetical protein BGZ63DRAFT_200733 [Mariannaea sp. PMI_226]|nr:hypothetical protein BGZ63DRAFT_200733 [Mariannaea sp. PMI_226]
MTSWESLVQQLSRDNFCWKRLGCLRKLNITHWLVGERLPRSLFWLNLRMIPPQRRTKQQDTQEREEQYQETRLEVQVAVAYSVAGPCSHGLCGVMTFVAYPPPPPLKHVVHLSKKQFDSIICFYWNIALPLRTAILTATFIDIICKRTRRQVI